MHGAGGRRAGHDEDVYPQGEGRAGRYSSQFLRERGGAEREEEIILNMHIKGYTSEQIAEIVEKSIEEVEAVIRKREPVLA